MYATRSCHPNAKIFYRPIDAALRWCNLMAFESEILEAGAALRHHAQNRLPAVAMLACEYRKNF